jgi:hypothetical protein
MYKGFIKKKDSLFLKIPDDNGQENSYVSLNCEILNNTEMIIRNEKSDPVVYVKYKR